MKDELVTVVIPVYNVEKYLDRCIHSVVNQTYRNLEIILVDDGSPDKCPEKCDEWAKIDPRIKVIHKANEGLGQARNTGIEKAMGRYICFLDSDDYIAHDTIEKTCVKAMEEKADVVLYGFNSVNKDGKVIANRVANPPKNVYEGEEVRNEFLANLIGVNYETGDDWGLQMSACMHLFSREILDKYHCRFESERHIISEDFYFLLQLYQHVKKLVVVKEAFYFYCENITSLTRTYRPDRFEKINFFYDKCVELCNICKYSDKVIEQLKRPYVSYVIAAMKQLAVADMPILEKERNFKYIIQDKTLQRNINSICMRYEPLGRKILLYAMKWKISKIVCFLSKMKA